MSPTLLLAVLAIAIVETALSGLFAKPYFTIGLPLFKCEVDCGVRSTAPPSPEKIATALPKTIFHSLVFSQLEPSRFAFRERVWGTFFRLSYTPVMHGSLLFDHTAGRVRVVGLANWFPLAFVALFAVTIPSGAALPFGAFLAGLLLFIYAIQFKRYREVANVAARSWENGSSSANAG